MLILKSIILGLVQGFTEFLPVSSSGHLVVFSRLLNFEFSGSEGVFFDVILHVGTLFAVVFAMRADIFEMLKKPFSNATWQLFIASVPAVVVGLFFSCYIEEFFDISCVFIGFYFTAFILLFADSFAKRAAREKITDKSALVMGVMQSLALLPGVSRSGSTLLGGVFCGVNKTAVAKFSFLMSIPIILGSLVFKCFEFSSIGFQGTFVWCCIFGGVSAFFFGLLGIKFFLRILKKAKLAYFSYYLFALATVLLIAFKF